MALLQRITIMSSGLPWPNTPSWGRSRLDLGLNKHSTACCLRLLGSDANVSAKFETGANQGGMFYSSNY